MADRYDLVRFKNAQDFGVYEQALSEIKSAPSSETKSCQVWKLNRANFGSKIAPTLETKSRQLWKQLYH